MMLSDKDLKLLAGRVMIEFEGVRGSTEHPQIDYTNIAPTQDVEDLPIEVGNAALALFSTMHPRARLLFVFNLIQAELWHYGINRDENNYP